MRWAEAITLGVVQGLTEFLPVSSSAHVSVVGRAFGGEDPGSAFTAITQLGTEAAVLLHFRRDIARIARQWCGAVRGRVPHDDPDARLGWMVLTGTLPIGVAGLALRDLVTGPFRDLRLTSAMLAAFGLVIAHADRRAAQRKGLRDLTVCDGAAYGFCQALALIPGVSRSGGTIAGGLALGYTREAAARYSFLLAIPAVLLSGVHQLLDLADDPVPPEWDRIAVATLLAFAIGHAVLAWLLPYVATHDLTLFVAYRMVLAAILSGLLATGVLSTADTAA